MSYPLLKATHYFGLALLLGGPVYGALRANSRGGQGVAPSLSVWQWGMFAFGLAAFLASGYLDVVRAAQALWGELYPGDVQQFMWTTRYGQVVLRKAALAVAFAGLAISEERFRPRRGAAGMGPAARRRVALGLGASRSVAPRPAGTDPAGMGPAAPRPAGTGPAGIGRAARGLVTVGLFVLGGAVVYHVSMASHSAGSGFVALVADVIHVTALAAWGGGLLYFAASRVFDDLDGLVAVSRRFSRLGAAAVAALAGTGLFMASRLIYGLPAVTGTPYGLALVQKVAIFATLLGLAAANRFYFVPGLGRGRGGPRFVVVYRWAVRLEAALLLFLLLATGWLTTQSPPKEPQALPGPMQQHGVVAAPGVVAGDEMRYHLGLMPGARGELLFELRLEDSQGRPVTVAPPFMDLTMPDHLMPPYHATLRPAEAGVYRTALILPMSGFWRVFIQLKESGRPPGGGDGASHLAGGGAGQLEDIVVEFKTAKSPREQQLVWYVSHYRVTRSGLGVAALLWWMGLLALGLFGLRHGWGRGRFRPLQVSAWFLVVFAAWQVVSMFVAKGYPTEHKPNPVPVTASTMERGRELFVAHCVRCHGPGGQGDGPLRDAMWPPPSDLTIYTPWHADGELFWFISKGVGGTGMPAFERELTEEERWSIVHYLRTLPPREGPYADWYPGHRRYFLNP